MENNRPTEHRLTWTVTENLTAYEIGPEGAGIFSTPHMINLMEIACMELAKHYIQDNQYTVGAEVHCRHLKPTPVGMKATAHAKLRSVEGRKFWFDVEVFDEEGKCGEGSHLRAAITRK